MFPGQEPRAAGLPIFPSAQENALYSKCDEEFIGEWERQECTFEACGSEKTTSFLKTKDE